MRRAPRAPVARSESGATTGRTSVAVVASCFEAGTTVVAEGERGMGGEGGGGPLEPWLAVLRGIEQKCQVSGRSACFYPPRGGLSLLACL